MDRRLILVDGYNLILRTPALRPGAGRTLAQSRDKLVNLLGWSVGAAQAELIVVFDGAEGVSPAAASGRVAVRYSRPPEKADDVLRALVEERVGRGPKVSVVTADLEVARHARAMGADVVLSDLFLAGLMGGVEPAGLEKPTQLSRKELEEWAELFRQRRPEEDE
jgi:predicted RNA-binding protein with PIN domain